MALLGLPVLMSIVYSDIVQRAYMPRARDVASAIGEFSVIFAQCEVWSRSLKLQQASDNQEQVRIYIDPDVPPNGHGKQGVGAPICFLLYCRCI